MKELNDILNPPEIEAIKEKEVEEPHKGETAVELAQDEAMGEAEKTQTAAAAENEDPVTVTPEQLKAEKAALAKERERVRQKEAHLEQERARLAESPQPHTEVAKEEKKDPQAELKELRKQHREAMKDALLDPEDEVAAKKIDDLEERMDELKLSIFAQTQRAMTEQEKVEETYSLTYKKVHEDFPFLSPDHPQANAALNENINTYMAGRIQKGESRDVALKKAVDLFAPAYAASLENDGGSDPSGDPERTKKEEADRLIKAKLSRGGFSEVRSVGSRQNKGFSGPTPMSAILKSKPG
jgi:hypothetical protein